MLLLLPIAVTPYVSRVLTPSGVGLYSFANSIISYFLLVAVLGTATYGQRAISYAQEDAEARSRAFWEIFLLRAMTSLLVLAVYVGYSLLFVSDEIKVIYLILTLNIINVIFDVSWFLQGLEEFGKTAFTSLIFRMLSIGAIFLFVKSESDLPLYALFMVAFTLGGNFSMWMFLPKYLCKVKGIHPFHDIKTVLQLFIPTIAIQVYTVLDKSMIGWFSSGYNENGYYDRAEQIVKLAVTAVTALGAVMIPRISHHFKAGNLEGVNYYIYRSYRYVWMMGIPIVFGFIAVADIFSPIYFGPGYEMCEILIPVLSGIVLFIGLSNVSGMQYFVPTGREKILTLTVLIGSGVNFVLNLILIPLFHSLGASIGTLIAEFSVALAGFLYIRKHSCFPLKSVFLSSMKYWIAGILMLAVLMVVKLFLPVAIWSLIMLIGLGVVIYFLLLLVFRDKFLLEILGKFFSMFKRPNN